MTSLDKKARKKAYKKQYYATKTGHIRRNLGQIKNRAKRKNIEFDLDFEYVESLAVNVCPVFEFDLSWCQAEGKILFNSPSLDRIDPSKGYVKGNVQFVSHLANTMKSNASLEQLKKFANWILNN
ncbi:hypothetical protein UFOVP230_64 [uncultured Caudovirales phage]|uniref:Uncharacterized protein n=1 Tax=uncultured Caudovirales phage TaxID=2100421 RepID=A0A6J7XRI3_9CAUD|nr:hypothetical protein UFOVP230_64 [uncultured Caudovirales phage]